MNKIDAIVQVYRIATLNEPTDEVMELLASVSFDRALEVLLLMRQYGKPIRTPGNFLRRAIQEGWTPETTQRTANRRLENIEQNIYMRRGYSEEEARRKVLESRQA